MRTKKLVGYHMQYNLDGGIDIVQSTTTGKIVGHTDNEEAAKELMRMLNEQIKEVNK